MRHVRSYKELFENQTELSQEQIEWLDEFAMGRWTLNPQTGLVDVRGSFDCSLQNLADFKGVRFGEVTVSFDCSHTSLTSLEGAPQKVGDGFYCNGNQLTTLEGSPQIVVGDFSCAGNRLTTLKGSPQSVGCFYCSDNQLTTLEGAPQTIRGDFSCAGNQLTTLKGAPESVGRGFTCDYNQLTSLEGAPKTVDGNFYCSDNPVSEKTLKAIFKLMRNGMGYQQALEVYWPNVGEEDRVLMYKQIPNLPLEDARTYKALATYSKIKGYL